MKPPPEIYGKSTQGT